MRYTGGKNGSGVYQRIISTIPPHHTYIELFAGSAAILRRKRPAAESYAYELNPATICELISHIPAEHFVPDGWDRGSAIVDARLIGEQRAFPFVDPATGSQNLEIRNSDALAALREVYQADSFFWVHTDPAKTVMYADPPYLMETRAGKKPLYQFEMFERAEHIELLDLLAAVPCKVLVSGYDSPLYNQKLKHWRRIEIPTVNRAGDRVTEIVWANYPEPFELHDYRYLGDNYRDRWTIKKRARRWVGNWQKMEPALRYAILDQLNEVRDEMAAQERG
jgi:hypothetical protein